MNTTGSSDRPFDEYERSNEWISSGQRVGWLINQKQWYFASKTNPLHRNS